MRTSWTKLSGLILFSAAVAYGCSSDSSTTTPAAEAGASCGNKTLDKGEVCDGALLGGKTCATAMLSTGTVGSLKCKADCSGFDTASCSKGSGGGGGVGGGTGGAPVGNGGAPSAGGKKGVDGGVDSGTADKDSGPKGTGGTLSTDAGSKADASDGKAP